ncbi:MAG: hypothetical protein ABFC71_03765 [Methanoregula sp.]
MPIEEILLSGCSVFITVVLVIVTYGYLIETKKIRLLNEDSLKMLEKQYNETRKSAIKPVLSVQSDDYPRTGGKTLYLSNYGPVATRVTIKTRSDGSPESSFYLYTLGTNERISVCGEWTSIERRRGKLEVEIQYCDAENNSYSQKIVLDYSTDLSIPIFIPVPQPVRVDCYQQNRSG